jgi:ABC-type nitrate/sulfonate/bicarbonate transport system substrate-binding protein
MLQISKACVALTALTVLGGAGSAMAQGLTKVTIGLTSGSIAASVARVAKEMGLFEKHGLDASISIMDSGSIAAMALISNSLNFATGSLTDAIVSQAQGQDIVSLASVNREFAGTLVLAKSLADKLGISSTSPLNDRLKAVNGLVVATPSATSTYTFVLKAATEPIGVKPSFTYMAQPAMVAALQTGAVQAIMVGAPFYAQAEVNGTGVILVNGPKGEFPKDTVPSHALVLNAQRAYAIANPELVAKMRAVFADMAKAATENPDSVRAAIGKLFPDIDAKTLATLFESEVNGFKVWPLSEQDIAQDIAFLRKNGVELRQADRVTPANIFFKK